MKKHTKGKHNYEKENLAAYRRCLRKEKERDKDRRETDQGSFEACMLYLDDSVAFGDDAGDGEADSDQSPYWESDNGEGGEVIRSFDEPDAKSNGNYYTQRRDEARGQLMDYDISLVPVFDLVLENGNNNKESICQLMHIPIPENPHQVKTEAEKRMTKTERMRRYRARVANMRHTSSTCDT